MTKRVGAAPGSFMVKRSGENFSTAPRVKRLTSARSPLRQCRWATFGQAFRSSLQRPSFLKPLGPQSPGLKPPVDGATSSTTRPSRTFLGPKHLYSFVFALGAGLHRNHELIGCVKRREGGGWPDGSGGRASDGSGQEEPLGPSGRHDDPGGVSSWPPSGRACRPPPHARRAIDHERGRNPWRPGTEITMQRRRGHADHGKDRIDLASRRPSQRSALGVAIDQ